MAVRIAELVARFRAGESDRAIARSSGLNRRTVARYRRWAAAEGAITGPQADVTALPARRASTSSPVRTRGRNSSVERFREEIAGLLANGLNVTAIRAQLEQRHGQPVSYSAVWRLARQLRPAGARDPGPDETVGSARGPEPDRRQPGASTHPSDRTNVTRSAQPVRGTAADEFSNPLVTSRLTNEEMLVERHAHLVATATDLLLHRGFHRTSVRDIAAAAGWQIGTLYLYISRKEDILHLILDEITRSFLAELRKVEQQETARATLRAAAERYFRAVAGKHRELRLLYRESASLDLHQRQFGMQREFAQRDVLADIIRWGIAIGEFRPVHPEEFAHTIIMLAHMWGLKGWALIGTVSLDQFVEDQLDLVFSRLDLLSTDEARGSLTASPTRTRWSGTGHYASLHSDGGKGIAAK